MNALSHTAADADSTALPAVVFALGDTFLAELFDPELVAQLGVDFPTPSTVIGDWAALSDEQLSQVEVVITGWGSPLIDADVQKRMPKLRAVCHSAGTVRPVIDPIAYARGVRVTSAAKANAVPVAEFAQAMIILACKKAFQGRAGYLPGYRVDHRRDFSTAGNYRRKVGLIGASTIGRLVIEWLSKSDLDLLVADPYLTAEQAQQLGVTKVELDDLLSRCDVVSLHAPLLDSTRGMVGARELALLPDGATVINTARGGLIDHAALQDELLSGRIWAVLDTTDPFEPLPSDSPLFGLPNVFITPHIAGSQGNELRRMGDLALGNAIALLADHEATGLEGEVTAELFDTLA